MKYTYKITIECDPARFDRVPSKTAVMNFLKREALTSGGNTYPGDEVSPQDFEFTLYRYGTIKIQPVKESS